MHTTSAQRFALFEKMLLIRAYEERVVRLAKDHSFPGICSYDVAKQGVVALSEVLLADARNAGVPILASVLCPGWVNTNIHASERNRPTTLGGAGMATAGDPRADMLRQINSTQAWIDQCAWSVREGKAFDPATGAFATSNSSMRSRLRGLSCPNHPTSSNVLHFLPAKSSREPAILTKSHDGSQMTFIARSPSDPFLRGANVQRSPTKHRSARAYP